MAYGTIKVDTITFTDAGVDKSVTISGLVQNPTFSGNITVTGTVSGNTIQGQTVSGATITGGAAAFTTVTGGVATITSGVFALGSASNPSISFTGDANTGLYSPGADQVAISTNGTGRLFVDASGKVGLGVANPVGNLAIYTPFTPTIYLQNSTSSTTATDGLQLALDSADGYIWNFENGTLRFATNNTERLRITSAGLVGVGTSSPGNLLHVSGTSSTPATFERTGTTGTFVAFKDSTSLVFIGNTNGVFSIQTPGSSYSDKLVVTSAGNVGVGTTDPKGPLHVAGSSANAFPQAGGALWLSDTNANTNIKNWSILSISGDYRIITGTDTYSGGELAYKVTRTTGKDVNEHIWYRGASIESMRIDSSGRLGIGTSSPSDLLHLSGVQPKLKITGTGGTSPSLVFDNASGYKAYIQYNSAGSSNGLQFYDVTNAADRMFLDASGRLGIGTTSPNFLLTVGVSGNNGISINNVNNGGGDYCALDFTQLGAQKAVFYTNSNNLVQNAVTGNLIWQQAGTERARLDTSGRLLIGTSTARANLFNGTVSSLFQIEGTATTDRVISVISSSASDAPPNIVLGKQRSGSIGGNTIVASGDGVGVISFQGNDGSEFVEAVRISAEVDGTPGANDMPGRLVFSTTADGASSPTERLRIAQNGVITIQNGAVAVIGTLTDGATITPDFAADCNFTVTLGGSRTIANPTNITAGQSGSIFIVQDATGSRTLSWGSYWDFPGGTAPTLSTAANAVDRVDYIVRSSTSIHTVFTANYS